MAVSLAAVSPAAGTEIADVPDTVFAEAAVRSSAPLPLPASRVERSRQVTLTGGFEDRLETSRSAFVFNLFDDVVFEATGSVDRALPGGFAWNGTTPAGDDVLIVMNGGDMTAHANVDGVIYEIRPLGDGVHAVIEIDSSGDIDEEDAPPLPDIVAGAVDTTPSSDGTQRLGGTVDVMIMWTQAAETAAGGAAAMQALVNLMISQTATIHSNSNIAHAVNLVHSAKVSYTESGSGGTDLQRLMCDGRTDWPNFTPPNPCENEIYMNDLHDLRNTYGADLVSLIVDEPSFGGVAYTPSALGYSYNDDINSFAVINWDAATSQYSYTHEIGHNQAAMHNREASQPGPGLYADYAAGHINNGVYRTVMAYSTGCNLGCTRQMVMSNPDVSIDLGPNTYPTSNGAALEDNARVLDEWADEVSGHRATAITETCNGLTATIVGTAAGETLNGTAGADVIVGLGGDDIINGGNGNDTICAGTGLDTVNGGNGRDTIFGEADRDTLNGDGGNDTIRGNGGNDTIFGGDGDDTLRGNAGNDTIKGDDDHDTINGDAGNDRMNGGRGNDTINGDTGNDAMIGGLGRDIMDGEDGNDRIRGGPSNDTLSGGDGKDRIFGQSGNDLLLGQGGDDLLNGGPGTDTLRGGPHDVGDKCGRGPNLFTCELPL